MNKDSRRQDSESCGEGIPPKPFWVRPRTISHEIDESSRLEDLSETAVESFTVSLQDQLGGLMAGAVRRLSPRTAEGVANGLLLARFGNVAKSLLRPVTLLR